MDQIAELPDLAGKQIDATKGDILNGARRMQYSDDMGAMLKNRP